MERYSESEYWSWNKSLWESEQNQNQNTGDGVKNYENLLKNPYLELHDHYIGVNVP